MMQSRTKELRERIRSLRAELAAAPGWKKYTSWYLDREEAIASCQRILKRLKVRK